MCNDCSRLFLVEVQSFCLVLLVVVGKHAEKCCYLIYGMFGVGTAVLVLKPKHRCTIEGVEAGFYLG